MEHNPLRNGDLKIRLVGPSLPGIQERYLQYSPVSRSKQKVLPERHRRCRPSFLLGT